MATSRRPERLDDLTREHGSRLLAMALDGNDPDDARSVVAAATESFGTNVPEPRLVAEAELAAPGQETHGRLCPDRGRPYRVSSPSKDQDPEPPTRVRGLLLPTLLIELLASRHPGDETLHKIMPWFKDPLGLPHRR